MNTTTNQQLEIEAAQWLSRLSSEPLSVEQQREFSRWLNRSDLHLQTYDRLSAEWQSIGASLKNHSAGQARLNELEANHNAQKADTHNQPPIRFHWRWQIAAACSLLLLAVAVFSPTFNPTKTESYVTAIGEQQSFQLSDGSTITLNTDSKVSVRYSDSERLLQLERGEAYFQVAHNRLRPFHVDTNRGRITALGTAFNIDQRQQSVTVIVTDGIVQVEQKSDPSTLLAKTEKVSINQQIQLTTRGLGTVNAVQKVPAWQQQRLEFDRQPLAEAILELNRYLNKKVQLNPDQYQQLASVLVSGVFNTHQPEQALAAIAASLQLTITDNNQGLRQLVLQP